MNGIKENSLEIKKQKCADWFKLLRDKICSEFEKIEEEFLMQALHYPELLETYKSTNYPGGIIDNLGKDFNSCKPGKFQRKNWLRTVENNDDKLGGGEISLMRGFVFEKVGVNFSEVYGEFDKNFCKEIPGAEENPEFWASGISLVAHMTSPLVPAVHINTRFISTQKNWFGGGSDLNPMYEDDQDTTDFHNAFKNVCDNTDENYYPKFKKWCDEYFFIKHRNTPRGVGGIFYDYLNSGNFNNDFEFTRNVGLAFLDIFPKIVRRNMFKSWNQQQRLHQLQKRGLYTEFNLVYDRGTKFGLMTNGNTEAILMSLPPLAVWS